ncbi:MAG TPA: hypothetical protein VMM78_19245 [Thermomicrobiales bacterium]|nr:hypothetical protein [Thermomicrobiales bacterium]
MCTSIVLSVGLDLGVITPALFTMMLVMALVTTLATTLLVRRLAAVDSVPVPPVTCLASPATTMASSSRWTLQLRNCSIV